MNYLRQIIQGMGPLSPKRVLQVNIPSLPRESNHVVYEIRGDAQYEEYFVTLRSTGGDVTAKDLVVVFAHRDMVTGHSTDPEYIYEERPEMHSRNYRHNAQIQPVRLITGYCDILIENPTVLPSADCTVQIYGRGRL